MTASRPLRLFIGAIVVVVIAVALMTPIVLSEGASTPHACTKTLRYEGRTYSARLMPSPPLVESVAIGIGVLTGCGTPASNIDARSLAGVRSSIAVGIPTDASSVYIRRGVCASVTGTALRACLQAGASRTGSGVRRPHAGVASVGLAPTSRGG